MHDKKGGMVRSVLKSQAGFSLAEIAVILLIAAIGLYIFTSSFLKKSYDDNDVRAVRDRISTIPSLSIYRKKWWGFYFDSSTRTIGIFEDANKNNSYDLGEPLSKTITLHANTQLTIEDSNSNSVNSFAFKMTGGTASELTYVLTFTSLKDNKVFSELLIIAANGLIIERT